MSSETIRHYKSLFAADRATRLVPQGLPKQLEAAGITSECWNELQRDCAKRWARHTGTISHLQNAYDRFMAVDLPKCLFHDVTPKTFPNRSVPHQVEHFKLVSMRELPPTMYLHTVEHHIPLSWHESRRTNSSCNSTIEVVILHTTSHDPAVPIREPGWFETMTEDKNDNKNEANDTDDEDEDKVESEIDQGESDEDEEEAEEEEASTATVTNKDNKPNDKIRIKAANAKAKIKGAAIPSASASAFTVPAGWDRWPIIATNVYRIPFLHMPVMAMSAIDPRRFGYEPSEAFLYESRNDDGGYYRQNEHDLHIPPPEGLVQNFELILNDAKVSEAMDQANVPPPPTDPAKLDMYTQRIWNARSSDDVIKVHYRWTHPLHTHRSTDTFTFTLPRAKLRDLYWGIEFKARYQYWQGLCDATVLLMACGVPHSQLGSFLIQYYQTTFETHCPLIIRQLIAVVVAKHPTFIQTQDDALVSISDLCVIGFGASFEGCNSSTTHTATASSKSTKKKIRPSASKLGKYLEMPIERKIENGRKFLQVHYVPVAGMSSAYHVNRLDVTAHCMMMAFRAACGLEGPHYKETYALQRYDTNETLLASLNRKCASKANTRMLNELRNETKLKDSPIRWADILDKCLWNTSIKTAFMTGNWNGDKKTSGASRRGVAMRFPVYNVMGSLGLVRRVSSSNRSQRRSDRSKSVRHDQSGYKGALETPEGKEQGTVQTTACGTIFSIPTPMRALLRLLQQMAGFELLVPLARSSTPAATISLLSHSRPPSSVTTSMHRPTPMELDRLERDSSSSSSSTTTTTTTTTGTLPSPIVRVHVENVCFWTTTRPDAVLRLVRSLRHSQQLSTHVSCEHMGRSIFIRCSGGRNLRPLLSLSRAVDWMKRSMTSPSPSSSSSSSSTVTASQPSRVSILSIYDRSWMSMFEIMDPLEERSVVCAHTVDDWIDREQLGERYTHLELDRSWTSSGILETLLPMMDRDLGTRGTLSVNFLKQALTNGDNPHRHALQSLTMDSAEYSPCQTRGMDHYAMQDVARGQLSSVAFCNQPSTQEDARQLNIGPQQLGAFHCTRQRTYVTANKVSAIRRPPPSSSSSSSKRGGVGLDRSMGTGMGETPARIAIEEVYSGRTAMLTNNYDKVDPLLHTAGVGQYLEGDDVVIMKKSSAADDGGGGASNSNTHAVVTEMDDSYPLRMEDSGRVVRTIRVYNDTQTLTIQKVLIQSEIPLTEGIKLVKFHGDKGVNGLQQAWYDSPFQTGDGQAYDIYTGIEGYVNRLNPGGLLNGEANTLCIQNAAMIDASMYEPVVFPYRPNFKRATRHGLTGEKMHAIVVLYCETALLKHFPGDKWNARGPTGPRQASTRQPNEGKHMDGGLKTGRMEWTAMISHGASDFSNQRINRMSDPAMIGICRSCQRPALYEHDTNSNFCERCKTGAFVVPTETTFTSTCAFGEIQQLGVEIESDVIPATMPTDYDHVQRSPQEEQDIRNRRSQTLYNVSTMMRLPEGWKSSHGVPQVKLWHELMATLPSLERPATYTATHIRHSPESIPLGVPLVIGGDSASEFSSKRSAMGSSAASSSSIHHHDDDGLDGSVAPVIPQPVTTAGLQHLRYRRYLATLPTSQRCSRK